MDLTEEEFYKIRDSRTNRIDEVNSDKFENSTIGLFITVNTITKNQSLMWTTINLLSRWVRYLKIYIPKGYVEELKVEIIPYIEDINPFLHFEIIFLENEQLEDYNLILGSHEKQQNGNSIWIDSNNWISYVSNIQPSSSIGDFGYEGNMTGSIFASSLGNAEIMKLILGKRSDPFQSHYSLYDYEGPMSTSERLRNPNSLHENLGNVLIIGCGAVGSNLIYLLSQNQMDGNFHIVDFDYVELSNTNRSLIFNISSINKSKVEVCEEYLVKFSKIKPFNMSFKDYLKEGNFIKFRPDIVISLANEDDIWSSLQTNYPPLTFHASTSSSWAVNVGRHLPLIDWCINCTFGKYSKIKMKTNCPEGVISFNENLDVQELGVLPFMSSIGAVLLYSELLKLNGIKERKTNSIIFENYSTSSKILKIFKKPFSCKICKDQKDIYKSLQEETE